MSGRGPAPKDPRERRNFTKPARGEWVDLPPLDEPVLPELSDDFSQESREVWDAWRWDPVTTQYSSADIGFALETIRLRERKSAPANEIRLRLDSLGLTPKGKRDLRWRIMVEADEQEQPLRAGVRPGVDQQRARLSVVK